MRASVHRVLLERVLAAVFVTSPQSLGHFWLRRVDTLIALSFVLSSPLSQGFCVFFEFRLVQAAVTVLIEPQGEFKNLLVVQRAARPRLRTATLMRSPLAASRAVLWSV